MKITRSKYPLVDYATRRNALTDSVFKGSLLTKLALSKYQEDEKYFHNYRLFIDDIANRSDLKAKLVANTVMGYLTDHREKLMTKMWPFLNEMSDATGIILWEDWTFFYKKWMDGEVTILFYFISAGSTSEIGMFLKEKGSGDIRGNSMESKASKVALMISTLVLPFLEFAECETKIVNAEHGKHTKLNKEKYVTDISNDIEIVDSSWFTTIIRTEGFGVHGHFRLQPIGAGRTARKMIWIKDFQKHGYTRRSHIEIDRQRKEVV